MFRPSLRRALLLRALLAGTAFGVVGLASAGLFLYDADGLLAASTGLMTTLILAFAAGLWAGAPTEESRGGSMHGRWFAASIAVALAGSLATWSLYEGVPDGSVWRVLNLVILVAAPVYVLGLLISGLLAWAEDREDLEYVAGGEEQADSGVWEPLGTLVIGTLAGIALGIAVAGLVLVPLAGSGPVLLGTAAALLVPTVLDDVPTPTSEERLLYEAESPLSAIRVVERIQTGRGQPERRLFLNGEEESGELARSGAPTLAYIAAAERWLSAVARPGERYLVLGGGAYTLPRRIAERDAGARITVVELDPEVTRVAYRFFGLRPEHRIDSVHGDARSFLEVAELDEEWQYDRIFVDVYHGHEALPYGLTTLEAFDAMRRRLTADGTVLLNVIGVAGGAGSRRLWSLVCTAASVFPSVAVYSHLGRDYPERQNFLVAAGSRPNEVFPDRAGMFEPWPRDEWPARDALVLRDLFEVPEPQAAPCENREGRAASAS